MAMEIIKTVKNAVHYDDGSEFGAIMLKGVRVSYPHLDKPYAGKPDKNGKTPTAAYSATFILPKKEFAEARTLIKDIAQAVLEANNRDKKTKKVLDIPADRKFFRDGNLSGKEEYQGAVTVAARETTRPKLRDAKRNLVTPEEARELFYPGCVVNALIRPWWQSNEFGKRINANLLAVQFVRDGDPIGDGGRLSDDDVDDIFDEEDDGSDGDSGYDEDDDEV